MSDQPPTGPSDQGPPVDPRWGPPQPGATPPPPSEQPYAAPPQHPAYGQPPVGPPSGQQPYGQAPHGQGPYGQAGYDDVVSGAPEKSKRGLALGGGALALALIAGGGLYVASQAGGGDGDQPESLVPSTAFAFAKIDLDPPADQKVAIHEFASKFPKGPKTDAKDPIDAILTKLFTDGEMGSCSYAADIKPWLGQRVAFAAVPATGAKTKPLVLIQVKDEAKARAAVTKLDSDACKSADEIKGDADDAAEGIGSSGDLTGKTFKGGYLVMAETQAEVDSALAAAKSKSLEGTETFKDDVAKLEGSQVVVMWADVARSFDAVASQQPQLNVIPNGIAKQFKGRLVMGLHMGNNFGEISGRMIGGDMASVKVAAPANLAKLPKSTVVALSATGVQEQIEKQLSQLGAAGANLDEMLGTAGEQLGLDVRKDLLPLLGSTTTLSLGNVPTGPADAKFGLQSTVTDPAAAKAAGAKLKKLAAEQGIKLDAEVDGQTFYLTSAGYAETLKGDGGLGGSPTFEAAMGTLGDQVSGALFVDIGQLSTLRGEGAGSEELSHLSAFGMSAGKDGDDGYLRMRLVVK